MRKPENNQENQDALLNELLRALPNKPVASNFTARVVDAAAREQNPVRQPVSWWEMLHHPLRLVPRIAVAALALGLGLFSYQRYEIVSQVKMAQSVAEVSRVASLPRPEVLRDFDAVQLLTLTPPADEELLALLQ